MKKLTIALAAALLGGMAMAQGAGRGVHKPGEDAPPPGGKVTAPEYRRSPAEVERRDYDRTPDYSGHVAYTPLAFGIGAFGMPQGMNWTISGLRLNLGLPGWTAVYENVYGIDLGLSGETHGETGGIGINVFNNTARDFYGIEVAGLWNRSLGSRTHALQVAPLFNFTEGIDGVQIGIYNRASELHGVQIGIVNSAVNGGGLQIGLWNDNGQGSGTPIIGIVF